MKRLTLIFSAIVCITLCLSSMQAEQCTHRHRDMYDSTATGRSFRNIAISKSDGYTTRKFPSLNYNGIEAGYSFVVVMCDTVDSIVVKINNKLARHLDVRYRENTLCIDLFNVDMITSNDGAKSGYVYVPYNLKLKTFRFKGSSAFVTNLPVEVPSFELSLSGSSVFSAARVTATTVSVDMCGSSRCSTFFACTKADVNLSGTACLKGNIKADDAVTKLSGSSVHDCKMASKTLSVSASGASKASLDGTTTDLAVKISGSANLDSHGMHADNVNGSVSGASKASVACSKKLEVSVAGSGTLRYCGNPEEKKISKSRSARAEAM